MLKELKAHHRNVLQALFNGFSVKEISERFEVTPTTIYNIRRSPLGASYMESLADDLRETTLDVRKELIGMNKQALATFARILDPKTKAPAAVQATVAKDILDRTGFKATDKLDINMNMQLKTDEEINAEIAALEESIKKTEIRATTKLVPDSDLDV